MTTETYKPSNPDAHLPAAEQVRRIKADMRAIRSRGTLRRSPWVRAHFWNRLRDARKAEG